jgi:hypothetical protein
MLKTRSTSNTFLSLRDLEAAPEEAMQLRRLIKSLEIKDDLMDSMMDSMLSGEIKCKAR